MSSFRKKHLITRFNPGHWEEDEWINGGYVSVPIRASVQPASGEEVQNLPEGLRKAGAYVLFTSTPLVCGRETDQESDTIKLFGSTYEVYSVFAWQNGVINHYRALLTRKEAS